MGVANRVIDLDAESGDYRGVYVMVVTDDSFIAHQVSAGETWIVDSNAEEMYKHLHRYSEENFGHNDEISED